MPIHSVVYRYRPIPAFECLSLGNKSPRRLDKSAKGNMLFCISGHLNVCWLDLVLGKSHKEWYNVNLLISGWQWKGILWYRYLHNRHQPDSFPCVTKAFKPLKNTYRCISPHKVSRLRSKHETFLFVRSSMMIRHVHLIIFFCCSQRNPDKCAHTPWNDVEMSKMFFHK